jgi:hypothetical protein
VYPGLHRYPMGEGVEAVPLWAVLPGQSKKVATIDKINEANAQVWVGKQ